MRRSLLSLVVLLTAVAACSQTTSPTDPDDPGVQTGSLTITVVTTGQDLDADGYTVTVGAASQSVAANASVTFAGLDAGPVSVSLSGVDANCSPNEVSPLTVPVVGGETTVQTFNVDCTALQQQQMTLVAADRSGTVWIIDEVTGAETFNHTPMTDTSTVGTAPMIPLGVISSMEYIPSTGAWWMGMGGRSVCDDFCIYVLDETNGSPTFGQYVEFGQDDQAFGTPGLASDPATSRTFAFDADSDGSVYEVDVQTGALTSILSATYGNAGQGATFGLDGMLYLASDQDLYVVDVDTPSFSTVGAFTYTGFPPLTDPTPTIGSLATRASDGTVFGILKDGGGGGVTATFLVTVNLQTAEITFVASNTTLLDGLAYIPTALVQARQN